MLALRYVVAASGIVSTALRNVQYPLGTCVFDLESPPSYDAIHALAAMSYDAYTSDDKDDWLSVPGFNHTDRVEFDATHVRGYVFADDTNSTFVIAFKGTTVSRLIRDKDRTIVENDQYNDNLLFSCCFYKESSLLRDTCEGNTTPQTSCSLQCYRESLSLRDNYITLARGIVAHIGSIVPSGARIAFTGHSLGGAIAGMMGVIHGVLAVTFQAPGDLHYMVRTGELSVPSRVKHVYHFGHNADPIFMGTCNGRMSLCSIAGYVLDTQCHTGYTCTYDAVGRLGVSKGILTHRMKWVLDHVIPKWETDMPECVQADCSDCSAYDYR